MSNIVKQEAQQFQIQTLDEAMRYSEAIAQAGLVPDAFKRRPADILVAQEIAKAMEESTWTVMSEMSLISGKPSFSAKFMRSRIRQAGHKLRESFDRETGVARAVIIRHDDPEFEHVAEWDQAKAEQHGLWGKGHWRKNPELMLKNRALSEVMREACYEVMGGVAYTPDEVQDFAPVRHESRRMDQQQAPSAQQGAPQAQGGPQPQQAAPKLPTAQEWAAKLMDLEAAGELEKVSANMKWAETRGHGELFTMARSVHDRMMAAVHASQEGEQQVFEAEVVTEEKQAA